MSRSSIGIRRRVQVSVLAAAAIGAFLSFTLPAVPAFAYVRYRSESDCPYAWRARSIPVTGYPQGLAGMTVEQITAAAFGAAAVWSKGDPALAACTDLDLKVTMKPSAAKPPAAKYDHVNNLVFLADNWCPPETVGTPDCRAAAALAITSVFAKTWGEIVDADIEVNGVNFVWGDLLGSTAAAGSQDLQNALTHELGHLIGLDHTCLLDPKPDPVLDDAGLVVPLCISASEAVRATTMFASADPGDTTKRDLDPDDQRAVCETYPRGVADPLVCAAPDRGGCGIASVASSDEMWSMAHWLGWGGGASALALAAFVAGRRRARRR